MKISSKIEKIIPQDFIEQYLTSCGIENVKSYLNPKRSCFENPNNYLNMKDAINVFDKHLKNKSNFGILMDSDLDGTCSTAIIYLFCQNFGINPKIYFHSGKQHGLRDKIDEILKDDISFLIVPDAGTNDVEECKRFKDKNIENDILILDHHEILTENPCAIVINNQAGIVNKALSGAGVAFKFVQAYCKAHRKKAPNFEDIVAISLISDVCSLLPIENRAFVYYGFTNPQNTFLIEMFNTVCQYRGVNPNGVGWDVAPLANALARMDEQEYKTFFLECLIGKKTDYEDAIKEMKRVKRKQDNIVKEVTKEIEENLDLSHKTIVGFTDPQNKEIIGLIANKFQGKYRKPTILLREVNSTTWSGSLRSPIELLDIINQTNLASCMGHGSACGIVVKKANLNRLIEFLETLDLQEDPEYKVAGELKIDDISLNLAQDIADNKMLWGHGLENPKFYIHLDNPTVDIFRKATTTIKVSQNGISFLKFFCSNDMVEKFENLNGKSVNFIFELEVNDYNNVKSPQGNIIEWEIVENSILENEEVFDWDSIFV